MNTSEQQALAQLEAAVLTFLATKAAPAIGSLVLAVIQRLAEIIEGPADDFLEVCIAMVRGIDKDHPDWTGAMKRDLAQWDIGSLAEKRWKSLTDQQINTIIEAALAVQE